MLVPEVYRPRRADDVITTVRRNPLALIITNGPRTPFATHAPVIVERLADGSASAPDRAPAASGSAPEDSSPSLVGATLLGHLNRTNEHWQALREGGDVLIVFQGPHGYISPTYYEQRPAAPTWNFVTVHLRGRVEPLEPGEQTLGVVTTTVRELEHAAGSTWDMTGSLDYFRRIQPGVGAFRVHVESAEAMFKLSQEHPPEVRASIRDHLSTRGTGLARELSEAMQSEESTA